MNNSEWSVDNTGEVLTQGKQPLLIRFFAHFFSYVFHPLFIPVYITAFLLFANTEYFVGFNTSQKIWVLVRVAYSLVFFPLVTVTLLKSLGFIESVFLHSQRDRIIPYIACGIFFFWCYLVFRNQPEIPSILTSFVFAIFLSSSAALMANIYFKVSMHAIGVGGAIALFVIILLQNTMHMGLWLSIMFLIAGLVCTSRMLVSNHTPKEIYVGLLIGVVCQFIAAAIYL